MIEEWVGGIKKNLQILIIITPLGKLEPYHPNLYREKSTEIKTLPSIFIKQEETE